MINFANIFQKFCILVRTIDGTGDLVRGFGTRVRSNTPGLGGNGSGNKNGGLGMVGKFDSVTNNGANAIEGAENAVHGMGGGYESGSGG